MNVKIWQWVEGAGESRLWTWLGFPRLLSKASKEITDLKENKNHSISLSNGAHNLGILQIMNLKSKYVSWQYKAVKNEKAFAAFPEIWMLSKYLCFTLPNALHFHYKSALWLKALLCQSIYCYTCSQMGSHKRMATAQVPKVPLSMCQKMGLWREDENGKCYPQQSRCRIRERNGSGK